MFRMGLSEIHDIMLKNFSVCSLCVIYVVEQSVKFILLTAYCTLHTIFQLPGETFQSLLAKLHSFSLEPVLFQIELDDVEAHCGALCGKIDENPAVNLQQNLKVSKKLGTNTCR